MLSEVKNRMIESFGSLLLEPKIYREQSLYFDYYIDNDVITISYNQIGHKIYLYYRSKKNIELFIPHVTDLRFIQNKNILVCDTKEKNIDSIAIIMYEVIYRIVHLFDNTEKNKINSLSIIESVVKNINIYKIIDKNLINKVVMLMNSRFDNDSAYETYLKYCCDIGLLELVYYTFEFLDKNNENLELFEKNKPSIKSIRNFSNDDVLRDLQNRALKIDVLENQLFFKEKLLLHIKDIENDSATPYQNMILNFLLVVILRIPKKNITVEECTKLFLYVYHAKNMNRTRKDVCCLIIIEYCINNDFFRFFQLPQKWYDYSGYIFDKITNNKILDIESTQELWNKYQHKVKKANSFNVSTKKKVAVCISGMYRNHTEALQSIKDNIIDPLEADVYIHTWENMSFWSGLGGNSDAGRILGPESLSKLPLEFHSLIKLQKELPKTYELICQPITQKIIDAHQVFSLLSPKEIFVECENDFIKQLGNLDGYQKLRGTTNQIKMFHGLKQSLDMALASTRYDYIIRCRPDIKIDNKITIEMIDLLENNCIYTDCMGIGLGDTIFIVSSSMAYSLSNFIHLMHETQKLSPFDNFPLYDSHNLLKAWVHANNYMAVPSGIKRVLLAAPKISIPGLVDAIYADLESLNAEDRAKFEDFTQYLIQRNG